MRTFKWSYFVVLFLASGMLACSEDDSPDSDVYVAAAEQAATAQVQFSSVYAVASQALTDPALRSGELCADISLDTLTRTLVLDFGTGCTGAWGRERAGKMTINYQGIPFTAGSAWTVGLDNYTVNGLTLNGTLQVSNSGDGNGLFSFSYRVTDGTLTYENGETASYDADIVFRWVRGRLTPLNLSDDEWEMEGSSSGTTTEGTTYTGNIKNTLLGKQSCLSEGNAYFSSGILEVKVPALAAPMDVDFGDGSCDIEALISYGRFTQAISLR